MRLPLFLLVFATPLIELAVLIVVGQRIGLWWTLAIVIGTGVLGVAVLMENGVSAPLRIREAMGKGEAPLAPMLEGALVVMAGILLLTPGLIADAVGVLLLIPPLRRLFSRWAVRHLFPLMDVEVRTSHAQGTYRRRDDGPGGGDVIEGEFERLDERTIDPNRRKDDDKPR
ncbi:MAG: FxsA family protein [Hyphomicrobiaceae bacterium]